MSSHARTDRIQKIRFARIGMMRKGVVLVIKLLSMYYKSGRKVWSLDLSL